MAMDGQVPGPINRAAVMIQPSPLKEKGHYTTSVAGFGNRPTLTFAQSRSDNLYFGTPWAQNDPHMVFTVTSNSDTSGYAYVINREGAIGSQVTYVYYDGKPGIGYWCLWGSAVTDPCITCRKVNYPNSSITIVNDGTPVSAGNTISANNFKYVGNNSSDCLEGDIAEIVIFNATLSSGDEDTMWSYLSTRYGISIT